MYDITNYSELDRSRLTFFQINTDAYWGCIFYYCTKVAEIELAITLLVHCGSLDDALGASFLQ